MESRAFIDGLIVGILATVTMDVVAVIALRLAIAGRGPRRTGPDLIGRWIGYLLRGKFRHSSESRLSVSRSQGSGSRSGVSRCGPLIAREDGVKRGRKCNISLAIPYLM